MRRWLLDRAYNVFTPLELFRPGNDDVLWNADIVHRSPDFKLLSIWGHLT